MRRLVGSLRVTRHRRPVCICTHRTSIKRFWYKFRTRSGIERCLTSARNFQKISKQIGQRCPSGYRPMVYESNCHRWEATWFWWSTYYIYINILLLKTKNIYTKLYISFEQLRIMNMQPTCAIEFFAVLSKCGFLLYHCQSQSQSFLF